MATVILGIDPTRTWTSTEMTGFQPGDVGGFDDINEGYKEFVFGQAEANALAIGNVLVEGPGYVFTRVTTTNSAPGQVGGHGTRVAIAMAVVPANGFGWFQIYGRAAALTAAAVAVGTRINTTATAGAVDDDGTVGARPILGMVWKTLVASGTVGADCRLSYPTIGLTI